MSNSRARVRVGSTRRRIIWRARSGSRISPSSAESRTAPPLRAAAKISPCVCNDSICWPIRLDSNLPRYRKPTASNASGSTLTAMIRRVSGDTLRQRKWCSQFRRKRGSPRLCGDGLGRTCPRGAGSAGPADRCPGAAVDSGAGSRSAVAVSITDAIEGFDLAELGIDRLELLAQPLDVAVDRAVIDIDVLAIGRVHQLVAVLDVARTLRQGFEDQELGHGQLDRVALPGALMTRRVERHLAAHDDRLGLSVLTLAGQFAAPDQGPDALDQQPLRKRLADVIIGPPAQAKPFVGLVLLARQGNHRDMAVAPELTQQLHPIHPRHLDVEHGKVHRLRGHALQRFGAIAEAAYRKPFCLERHRQRGQ